MDTQTYMDHLQAANPLRESTIKAIIEVLQLPSGSRGLDAGCGIGLQCLQLAEAVGLGGHITGMDMSPEFLERGREIAEEAGLGDRISFEKGDISSLPFDDNSFDWLWSSDCVGYGPWEPVPLLKEMARVVKPGGVVALAAWSSQSFLPGFPLLEARLAATPVGLAPFIPGKDPGKHFLRALGWFRELGFVELRAEVFAKAICAPENEGMRNSLVYMFESRWNEVESELEPEDREEFQLLCNPDSPDFIVDNPDYYGFFNYSAFWGNTPE